MKIKKKSPYLHFHPIRRPLHMHHTCAHTSCAYNVKRLIAIFSPLILSCRLTVLITHTFLLPRCAHRNVLQRFHSVNLHLCVSQRPRAAVCARVNLAAASHRHYFISASHHRHCRPHTDFSQWHRTVVIVGLTLTFLSSIAPLSMHAPSNITPVLVRPAIVSRRRIHEHGLTPPFMASSMSVPS